MNVWFFIIYFGFILLRCILVIYLFYLLRIYILGYCIYFIKFVSIFIKKKNESFFRVRVVEILR